MFVKAEIRSHVIMDVCGSPTSILPQWCIALMNEIIGWSGACATYSKQMASPYIRQS
jgi:hypothetical protein